MIFLLIIIKSWIEFLLKPDSGYLIVRTEINLLGGFQTKNLEEESPPWRTTPKIDRFWGFEGGFLFLQVLDLGSPQRRNPPWGEFLTIKLGGLPRTGGSRALNNARRILSKGSTLLRGCWFWSKKLLFRKNFDENFNAVERVSMQTSA